MVKALIGNLFDSKAQTIVNTVNCVGVIGKGVATSGWHRDALGTSSRIKSGVSVYVWWNDS